MGGKGKGGKGENPLLRGLERGKGEGEGGKEEDGGRMGSYEAINRDSGEFGFFDFILYPSRLIFSFLQLTSTIFLTLLPLSTQINYGKSTLLGPPAPNPKRQTPKTKTKTALTVLHTYLTSLPRPSSLPTPLPTTPTPTNPPTPTHPDRPFIYISADDFSSPFIPSKYVTTKREAERGIERLVREYRRGLGLGLEGEGGGVRGVYIRPGGFFDGGFSLDRGEGRVILWY